jgi:DNA (cytosine-5)-methyltransferase 1
VTTYYNENDPFAAAWLRNLMKQGLIYDGEVDERSIADVRAADLKGFTACHFFAGIGGWDHALDLAGWPAERKVWTGSCPCQPFSLAGKQQGFDDHRHLWPVWRDLIAECRPPTIFGEQVASASRWLGLVRGELEAMGYAVGAVPVEAASAGAYHLRNRYWFVADADFKGSQGRPVLPERSGQRPARADGVEHADGALRQVDQDAARGAKRGGARPLAGLDGAGDGDVDNAESITEREPDDEGDTVATGGQARSVPGGAGAWVVGADGKARRIEPGIRLLAHGIPNRVGQLRGFGNAIDPRPAQAFIAAYMDSWSGSGA